LGDAPSRWAEVPPALWGVDPRAYDASEALEPPWPVEDGGWPPDAGASASAPVSPSSGWDGRSLLAAGCRGAAWLLRRPPGRRGGGGRGGAWAWPWPWPWWAAAAPSSPCWGCRACWRPSAAVPPPEWRRSSSTSGTRLVCPCPSAPVPGTAVGPRQPVEERR